MKCASKHSKVQSWAHSIIAVAGGLGLASLIIMGQGIDSGKHERVEAQEANLSYTPRNPSWRGASFPVEQFQGYTSAFGYRRAPDGTRTSEFHHGLDIAGPEGSYIRNWWTGQVVEVSDDSSCGTSVVVESGPWLHIYCHMKGAVEVVGGRRYMVDRAGGVRIQEGQLVKAGTRIGRIGMTGRTTGPHLHWGLKHNNRWVDPAMVLREMYAQRSPNNSLSSRTN